VRGPQAVYAARFAPDGARFATASYDGRIQVWNSDTLALETEWHAHQGGNSCHALAWTADGRRLVSGSWEPTVRVWDVATGRELAALEQDKGTYWLAASPSADLAAACSGNDVILWDLAAAERARTLSGHASTVLAANFSPDGARVVSTARDGRALVWDVASGDLLVTIVTQSPDVAEACFTQGGTRLVVAGRGGHVMLHDADDGALVRELARHRHGVNHVAISPDGTRAALAADTIVLVDLDHGGIVGQLRPHRERPYHVDFDASGTRLVSCSTDETIAVSDTRPLRERLRASDAASAGDGGR
jgi:WD40 repeat protein